jgi:hypothetical protein
VAPSPSRRSLEAPCVEHSPADHSPVRHPGPDRRRADPAQRGRRPRNRQLAGDGIVHVRARYCQSADPHHRGARRDIHGPVADAGVAESRHDRRQPLDPRYARPGLDPIRVGSSGSGPVPPDPNRSDPNRSGPNRSGPNRSGPNRSGPIRCAADRRRPGRATRSARPLGTNELEDERARSGCPGYSARGGA